VKKGTYPVTCRLGDVFSDLLGRQTERTDLGSESRGCTDLTTSGSEVANSRVSIAIELES
jgi:hypothetical protein